MLGGVPLGQVCASPGSATPIAPMSNSNGKKSVRNHSAHRSMGSVPPGHGCVSAGRATASNNNLTILVPIPASDRWLIFTSSSSRDHIQLLETATANGYRLPRAYSPEKLQSTQIGPERAFNKVPLLSNESRSLSYARRILKCHFSTEAGALICWARVSAR